jgi:hypothetical protein
VNRHRQKNYSIREPFGVLLRLTNKEPQLTHENETPEQLPAALIDQLKLADRKAPLITSRVDREILHLAEAQFSGRRRMWQRRPTWAAIAATVLIALFVAQLREPAMHDGGAIYSDVDHSGRIDIADVLAIARMGDRGGHTQAELDAFAMRIVSLAGAEESS